MNKPTTTDAQKKATKKWQDNNKQKLKENSKKWYDLHKDERKIVVDKYYQDVLRPKTLLDPSIKYLGYKNATFREFRILRNIAIN